MNRQLPTLNTPYGLGEKNYQLIKNFLNKREIMNVLEFGSGSSTVRLASDFPNSTVTSIDQDEKYSEESKSLLDSNNIKNAEVYHCPLTWEKVGGLRFYYTYDLRGIKLESNYDFVLIDGPVESQTIRGREGVLYQVFSNILFNGIIVLDDYHRPGSKQAVRNWLNTYPKQLKLIEEYENIAILEKKTPQTLVHWPGFSSLIDNWNSLLKLGYKKFKIFLSDLIRK